MSQDVPSYLLCCFFIGTSFAFLFRWPPCGQFDFLSTGCVLVTFRVRTPLSRQFPPLPCRRLLRSRIFRCPDPIPVVSFSPPALLGLVLRNKNNPLSRTRRVESHELCLSLVVRRRFRMFQVYVLLYPSWVFPYLSRRFELAKVDH